MEMKLDMETKPNLLWRSNLDRRVAIPITLRAGIPFSSLATDPHRLKITNGTRLAEKQDGNYQIGAVLPNRLWRKPNITEIRILKAKPSDAKRGFFSVIDCNIPSVTRLRQKFRFIGATAHSPKNIYEISHNESEEIAQELREYRSLEIAHNRCLGVFAGPAGHQTITVETGTNEKIGLHIDSWSGLPLRERAKAPGRLCINLGCAPRELIVVNLPVSEIAALQLEEALNTSTSRNLTEIGRRFLRTFPNYPVVSITLYPLEGYLAPTENMIHDASTLRMTSEDISLTILGHFNILENANCRR